MKEFIHIGYPKNFSTTLQRDFFSKHPEIFYLGIGYHSNLGYRSSIIENAFELYIKSAKYLKYVEFENKFINEVQLFREQAEKLMSKTMVVSSEHLSFAFTHDSIDIQSKLQRIKKAFPNGTIILIIRNQFDLIKSLYKESIRVGLRLNFDKYLYSLFKYQDRNFLYDLRYDLIINLIEEIFGENSYKVLFFENYRDSEGLIKNQSSEYNLIKDICQEMSISYPTNFELSHHNEALSSGILAAKLKLNNLFPHDLGNHLLDSAEKHRIASYLKEDLNLNESEETLFSDVMVKRQMIEKAQLNPIENLGFNHDVEIARKLGDFFNEGNLKLQHKLGVKLDRLYFEFNFDN